MEKILPKPNLDETKEKTRIAKNIPLVEKHKQEWINSQRYNTGKIVTPKITYYPIEKLTFKDMFSIRKRKK